MKKLILIASLFFCIQTSIAQKRYFTKTGTISFNAGTAMEDIDAVNKSATCIFDTGTGQVEFAVLIKGFEFKRALMQEHFNESYMESDKYPKAVFKGKIVNIDKVNFQKDGSYPVTVTGTMEIHGVKKDIETNGTFKVMGERVVAVSEFSVLLSDFHIEIPGLVKDKISKTVTIKIDCSNTILK